MQRVATPAVTLAPVIRAVGQRAATSRKHPPPAAAVESAQAAAIQPKVEQTRGAAVQTVTVLDAAEVEKVKRNEFKTKLKEAIKAATPTPTTESQADSVMKTGAAKANETLRANLATEQDAAVGPLKSAAGSEVPASSQPAPPAASLQSEPVGAPPAPVSAAPVVPAPLPAERLDYSADRAPADRVMAENDVSKEQLQEGNDPAFGPTMAARSSAEKHEATAEAKYRQGESKVQNQAKVAATQALSSDLAGMHGTREQQIGKVVTQQLGTKAKDAKERQRITDTIDAIKLKTRMDVELTLSTMEKEAVNIFEDGLKRAEKAYLKTFNKAKGGVGTWLTTWGSDWEKLIKNSLAKARTAYLDEVDEAIDKVAIFIDGKLKAAKLQVADGRNKVENFVKGLDESVKQFGEDALQAVSADFDAMDSGIDQRRDGLINKLTEQYKASYQRMSAMEEKLREANKSLWQRVYDATVGLVKKIIAFKNMLLGLLGKAVSIIGDIIAHPIRFLGNLVSGVMLGLKNFMSKIGTYLLKGIMDWLFGALSGAGLKLPDKFDLPGIISIVLQVLGLTYANFRARAVAIVGEPVVATLEKTAEVFQIILKEGISGLWRFIQEQLTNLKSMVLDAIFDYIKEKVIIAGITWIIGLLNPASAFFKACKAIYDIVMFFVNRGRQIMALVNAVIDSLGAIAKGSIGVAAGFVENALAKAIPVAIGFLASLLGLGDPSKPVQGFIEKARAPVNKAIDWVINLVAKGVKTLLGKVKTVAGKAMEWWKKSMKLRAPDGKAHKISFSGTDESAVPMVASDPKAVEAFLKEVAARPEGKKKPAADHIVSIRGMLATIKTEQKKPKEKRDGTVIDKAFAAMVSPLEALLGAGEIATKDKPLEIDYPKPEWSKYPKIYVGPLAEKRIPQSLLESKSTSMIRALLTKKESDAWDGKIFTYQPSAGSQKLPNGDSHPGIAKQYRTAPKLVIELHPGSTLGGKLINNFFRPYGYRAKEEDGNESRDGDHLVEMQLGGPNSLENLWPLDASLNRSGGSIVKSMQVKLPGGSGTISMDDLKQRSKLVPTYLVIKTTK